MGEMADAMLNGLFCECCGVILDGEEPGYPRYCSPKCARERGAKWHAGDAVTKCSQCGHRAKTHGDLIQHLRDAH